MLISVFKLLENIHLLYSVLFEYRTKHSKLFQYSLRNTVALVKILWCVLQTESRRRIQITQQSIALAIPVVGQNVFCVGDGITLGLADN